MKRAKGNSMGTRFFCAALILAYLGLAGPLDAQGTNKDTIRVAFIDPLSGGAARLLSQRGPLSVVLQLSTPSGISAYRGARAQGVAAANSAEQAQAKRPRLNLAHYLDCGCFQAL